MKRRRIAGAREGAGTRQQRDRKQRGHMGDSRDQMLVVGGVLRWTQLIGTCKTGCVYLALVFFFS